MNIPTKLWLSLCALILLVGAAWCHGYHTADIKWVQKDTERKLADAEVSHKLSEEYRIKEKKLNETIGEIETRAINDSANTEMEYQAVMDRLRNASAHPSDGLRIKPALTCRSVSGAATTTGNGNEEVQAGLSPEIAGSAIGIGSECDQVVTSLDACQAYIELLFKDKEKPLE